ncbi:MAG: DUF4177 domain-containing protein [Oscillibacter sp.]|nr:DUF4177 domain-containing protein [Oscillibacter sp.]
MLEYEFETVNGGGIMATIIEDHREVIQRRAKQGWRFAGWVPAKQKGYGYIAEIDLIFERETGGEA